MTSYRRYVAEHGAATARAKRQIRRHGLETGPDSGFLGLTKGEMTISFGQVDLSQLTKAFQALTGRPLEQGSFDDCP